jgi:hypothetical protein
MPYELIRVAKGGPKQFAVISIDSGRLHGRTTKAKAQAQERLLESIAKKEKRK